MTTYQLVTLATELQKLSTDLSEYQSTVERLAGEQTKREREARKLAERRHRDVMKVLRMPPAA